MYPFPPTLRIINFVDLSECNSFPDLCSTIESSWSKRRRRWSRSRSTLIHSSCCRWVWHWSHTKPSSEPGRAPQNPSPTSIQNNHSQGSNRFSKKHIQKPRLKRHIPWPNHHSAERCTRPWRLLLDVRVHEGEFPSRLQEKRAGDIWDDAGCWWFGGCCQLDLLLSVGCDQDENSSNVRDVFGDCWLLQKECERRRV